ncbi:hypothetical protein JI721_12615 [Alicyclobacillus cycloheptanicus]|uniref:Sporulation protein YtxC n=1 Tax=Alicyclobacillus cycloheptanicus TaxID=1457 RepID=A0ABT9XET2_9BACL|nr:sporulation protein YtxC [Alicyclobacillus cycloheptanicus]MDQ0188801.1 putative sporulation protein YtxC [Alicyclobacillus cycloheptanicus]WDM00546.1 hypothetical protein JI721_12615 [Alicyclobacillus cycloheptanicus]
MHTLEIRSTISSAALSQVLMKDGFEVTGVESDSKRLIVAWGPDGESQLAASVASFLLQDWLHGWIQQRMEAAYSFLDEEEREYVSLLTFHAVRKHWNDDGDLPSQETIASLLLEALTKSLYHDVPLNLDAFVRFRMRDAQKEIDGAIQTMVDQFLNDREYEEFVAMLRYMLDAQPRTEQTLHLFCSDERVWLCDASGELIRDAEVTTAAYTVSEGEEVNSEDLAMSILIMRSPCSIVIHDITSAAPWPSFSETVERVFLDRAARCDHCSTCQELMRAARAGHTGHTVEDVDASDVRGEAGSAGVPRGGSLP